MKIVVTGAAGFIGSHLMQRLVAAGHEAVGFDAYDSFLYAAAPKRANAAALRESLGDSAPIVEGDINDTAALADVIDDSVDVVCHLAALAGVRPSLREPARYARTNVEGTIRVLEACRAAGVDRVVFASSSSVYGARDTAGPPQPFHEDDPCVRQASPYGASKRAGELVCSTYRDVYGMGVSALRFFTVYGPRQRPDMAIHKFAAAIATGEPITLFGDGSSRRDYTFIDDIVAGTFAACERVEPNRFTIYNLGGHQTTSLADLVSAIERTVGRDAIINRLADQPGDVPITFADVDRAHRELDYEPRTTLDAGIEAFWAWYREHRATASSQKP